MWFASGLARPAHTVAGFSLHGNAYHIRRGRHPWCLKASTGGGAQFAANATKAGAGVQRAGRPCIRSRREFGGLNATGVALAALASLAVCVVILLGARAQRAGAASRGSRSNPWPN